MGSICFATPTGFLQCILLLVTVAWLLGVFTFIFKYLSSSACGFVAACDQYYYCLCTGTTVVVSACLACKVKWQYKVSEVILKLF